MYNRYIPQPDGSYRRSRVPDPHFTPHPFPVEGKCEEPVPSPPCQPASCPCAPEKPQPRSNPRYHPPRKPPCNPPRPEKKPENCNTQVSSFLRNLLPSDFDTGDLLIVLLLLLMAGDCAEDQNSALLTLALYFIM